MRHVLAFDTATEHIAIAIAAIDPVTGVSRTVAETDFAAPRAALGALLPAVRELVSEAGLDVGEIDAVAVGRGPGSFTGVRIAVATAKGLAHGLSAPLVGFGTLDAVAWRFRAHDGLLAVVGDAMRGEVYPALFRCSDGVCARLTPDHVERPSVTAERWASEIGGPVLLTGNGLAKHGETLVSALGGRASVAEQGSWTPIGQSLVDAALAETGPASLSAVIRTDPVTAAAAAPAEALLPVYTRLSDAEEAERDRSGGVPSSGVMGTP